MCPIVSPLAVRRGDAASKVWLSCHTCLRHYDPVGLAAEIWKGSVSSAVQRLADRGAFSSKRSTSGAALVGYCHFRNARIAFDRMTRTMSARTLPFVSDSAVHAHFRLNRFPHSPATHWTSTAAELDAYLRGHTDPGGNVVHRLGGTGDDTVLVVPAYRFGRPVGVWAAARDGSQGPEFHYFHAHGESGGLAFWNYNPAQLPVQAEREPWVTLTTDPGAYLRAVSAQLAGGPARDMQLYGGPLDHRLTAGYRVRVTGPLTDFAVLLAAANDGWIECADSHGQFCRWETHVARYGVNDYGSLRPYWNPTVTDRAVASGWVTPDRVASVTAEIARSGRVLIANAIPIRRGLTVDLSATVWRWREEQTPLTTAVPVVERVYLDESRRTRYAGYVLYANRLFAFDSARFRKDPSGVMETAILRGGGAPPSIHPVIVPHLATIALYLRS